MDTSDATRSFWKTLPGILSALAALITAVGGLITVLYSTGVFRPDVPADTMGTDTSIVAENGPFNSATADSDALMPLRAVPQDGSTISQPYVQRWRFSWDAPQDAPRVRLYHLRVFGANAAYPVTDVKVDQTAYEVRRRCSFVTESHRRGWTWRVRVQYDDDTWSAWTPGATFDVHPFDRDTYCAACPDAPSC